MLEQKIKKYLDSVFFMYKRNNLYDRFEGSGEVKQMQQVVNCVHEICGGAQGSGAYYDADKMQICVVTPEDTFKFDIKKHTEEELDERSLEMGLGKVDNENG